MAYNLSQRFSKSPTYYRISDPGAYQKVSSEITPLNKAPFLSNAARCTTPNNKLWTHAIYNTDIPTKIFNCTALKSKSPRFPYESMTKADIEQLLCRCGIDNTCECSTSEHEDEKIVCQGKIRRRLFKGTTPRSNEYVKQTKKSSDTLPPFYDARVLESTAFYRGCKWSQWTSKRSSCFALSGPGPADYNIEKQPCPESICAEKVRAHKRKTSKQLRYIEMVQQKNIRESFPGPGTYNPKTLVGTDLKYVGPRAGRFFTSKYDVCPGPSEYLVKRDFEPPEIPDKLCHAHLKDPAPFGCRAMRFKYKYIEGPSPATYNVTGYTCLLMRCSKVPFGISTVRFKRDVFEDREDYKIDTGDIKSEEDDGHPCPSPTWVFRSKTVRLKPLFKRYNEPSPADLPQRNQIVLRSAQLQNTAPFFTSNERFRPWFNWIPIHASINTPGPGYYCLDKTKCQPAVHRGPLFRSVRFKNVKSQSPSPNQYNVGGGVENILATHNERLKDVMKRQHKFIWKPKNETRNLSFAEKELMLIKRSVELLDVQDMK